MGTLCVQEEEAKLKPGTDKHIAFQCLKDAGAAGLNITQIIDAAKQNGVKDLDENSKRVIQYVSCPPDYAIHLRPVCAMQGSRLLTPAKMLKIA